VLEGDTATPGKLRTSALVHVVRVFTALLARQRQKRMIQNVTREGLARKGRRIPIAQEVASPVGTVLWELPEMKCAAKTSCAMRENSARKE
jgi:hypothetical protein